MAGLDVTILGPLGLSLGGVPVALSGPRQRAVVAALAIRANQVVSIDRIIDDVWGDEAVDRVGHSLQQHISSLRKLLAGAGAVEPAAVVVTRDPGYVLVVGHVDADQFERLAVDGGLAAAEGRHLDALTAFDAALACWRGPVLADVPECTSTMAVAVRLDERRLAVAEDRVDALLALGRARDAVPVLDALTADHPYRERLRAQHMLALYRCGRQTDALAAYQDARRALVDGLGIDPGPELRELEQAILDHSESLELGAAPSPAADIGETYRAAAGTAGRLELPDGQFVVLIDGAVIVGRDPAASVRMIDSRVSRRHAEVVTVAGESMIVDTGSTNGTFVNGVAITRATLADGDTIGLGGIGGVELRYRSDP